MIDPKGDSNASEKPEAGQDAPPYHLGGVDASRRLTDGGLLHLIPPHHAMHTFVKFESKVQRLFGVLTGQENEYLIDSLVQGVVKLMVFEVRGNFAVFAMQVVHNTAGGGVLRFWKEPFFRPGPDLFKFITEYAARHGCKAVDYINAPMRSNV